MKTVRVSLARIVDGGMCLAATDGQRVHREIYDIISKGDKAEISFFGVSRMTTAFLNAAVGQLYGEFSEDYLRRHLAPPVDFEEWHLRRLKLVVDRAKTYFARQEEIDELYRDNLGDEDA